MILLGCLAALQAVLSVMDRRKKLRGERVMDDARMLASRVDSDIWRDCPCTRAGMLAAGGATCPASCTPRFPVLAGRAGVLVFSLLMIWQSGCTPWRDYVRNGFKVGPEYQRPAAAVAEHWIDEDDKRLRDSTDEQADWWTAFNDPVLNELVTATYAQSLTLREAGFRVLEARANRAIAVGGLFPQQQSLDAEYTRSVLSRSNIGLGALLPTRFFSGWETGGNLAWELDFWGRFRRAVEEADAELDASVDTYDDVLVVLLSDTAKYYVELRTYQSRLQLARANIKLQRKTLEIAQARFKGGLVSELDVDQAQSNLSQTEALVPQLEIGLRQANDQLCILLGIPPEDLTKRLAPGPIPTAPPNVAVGIPAELLARRPDVRRAERRAAAQCAKIGIAEADLYPQIAVTGSIGVSAREFRDLFRQNSLAGSIGPSVQWNVLNYGRLLNGVRAHDDIFQALVARYQHTVLKANAEVEDGLSQFFNSQEQTRNLAESVTASDKAVQVALAQYRGGLTDFNRLAVLEQSLVQQQDQLAQAQGNIAQGLIAAYKALGGGWQIRLGPQPPAVVFPPAWPNNLRPQRTEKDNAAQPDAISLPGPEPEPMPQPPPEGDAKPLTSDEAVDLTRNDDVSTAEHRGGIAPVQQVSYEEPTTTGESIRRLPPPQFPAPAFGDRR